MGFGCFVFGCMRAKFVSREKMGIQVCLFAWVPGTLKPNTRRKINISLAAGLHDVRTLEPVEHGGADAAGTSLAVERSGKLGK